MLLVIWNFFKDSLVVQLTDGNLSISIFNEALSYFNEIIDNRIKMMNSTDYTADLVDIIFEPIDDETLLIKTHMAIGYLMVGNYQGFDADGYWYWGHKLGRCGQYQGLNVGRDAASELQWRFNNPVNISPNPGYYTNIVTVSSVAGNQPPLTFDPNNPAYPLRDSI